MVNGALFMMPDPGDFGLERSDTRIKLGHGKRIEILPRECCDRIICRVREILVGIHAENVDRRLRDVNKARLGGHGR